MGGGGVPVRMRMLIERGIDRGPGGVQVTKIEGVFSGTMSYIFNEFSTGKEGGPSFSSVVRVAREKGYTVRCPRARFLALALALRLLPLPFHGRSSRPDCCYLGAAPS